MKEKTSITLSKEVLTGIDRIAGSKQSRSAFIEAVLTIPRVIVHPQNVKQRRLPCSVGAEQGDDGALVDPMETLDPGAYRATGMRGNGTVSSDGLWSIWTMRRLQAHITSLAHTNPQDDLVTASTLLDGVHAPAVRTCLLGTRSGSGTRRMPSHSVPAHRECSDDDAGC